jgi:hypothetical protein
MPESHWLAARMNFRALRERHSDWTIRAYAEALGQSRTWVKKWQRRFRQTPDDPAVCHGRSRTRTTITPAYSDAVITAVLAIRDTPPARLNRIPGPKTILYYLQQDASLAGQRLPRSTRTIWRILRQHGRLTDPPARVHVPLPRPGPMVRVQWDFKDDGAPATDPDGKQQHAIETLTGLDVGTSSVVDSQTREDFQAGTTIEAVAQIVEQHGLPQEVQYDRDPRFIGGTHQREFPSPFTRFWLCLGVVPIINPPQRPDRNDFIERYHRNLKYECLWVYRPKTLDEIRTVVAEYQAWYNHERPSQAITCGNQPPRVAFPNLPALPGPPMLVDPDRWVEVLDGVAYARRVTQQGAIMLDGWTYYVGLAHAGRDVTATIDAKARQLVVYQGTTVLKRVAIKGLVGAPLAFHDFVAHLVKETTSPLRKTAQFSASSLQRTTPLERKTPLVQKTPLVRTTPLRQRTPLRRQTALRRRTAIRRHGLLRRVCILRRRDEAQSTSRGISPMEEGGAPPR